MIKYVLPLVAAGMAASSAFAAPTITFSQKTALPGYTTATVFESFENQVGGGATFVSALNAANDVALAATETGTANAKVFSATVTGVAVDTDTNPTNKYLSILAGASYSVVFGAPVQFFSFNLGSLDAYNDVKLTLVGGTIIDLLGSQIVGGNSGVAGRVNYDFGGGAGLTGVTFSSSADSFEIDDLAAAVPEAATWAMMMLGVGVIGAALRRRSNVATRVQFA